MTSTRPALYRRLLTQAFDALPASLRELHDLQTSATFDGEAEVIAAVNPLARMIALCTGFPTHSLRCAVSVQIDIDAAGETWHRDFAGHRFHSRLQDVDGRLVERLGPHRITFALHTDPTGLHMQPIAWRTFGIALPKMLWPHISAQENERDGRFHFDVATAFPLIGNVIHYRGWLQRRSQPPP